MNFNSNMTVGLNRLLLAAGLVLLLAAAGCLSHGQKPAAGTSIPQIASIANVQIGYSSQEDLERAWGMGLTTVGSHPNSGEVWRVPGTPWLVFTDGFYYSERGLVVDTLSIAEGAAVSVTPDEAESWRHAPEARPGPQAFVWLEEISPGMLRAKVVEALTRYSLKFTQTDGEVVVQARGFSPVTSETGSNFRVWGVTLEFQHDRLIRLFMAAQLERDEQRGIAK